MVSFRTSEAKPMRESYLSTAWHNEGPQYIGMKESAGGGLSRLSLRSVTTTVDPTRNRDTRIIPVGSEPVMLVRETEYYSPYGDGEWLDNNDYGAESIFNPASAAAAYYYHQAFLAGMMEQQSAVMRRPVSMAQFENVGRWSKTQGVVPTEAKKVYPVAAAAPQPLTKRNKQSPTSKQLPSKLNSNSPLVRPPQKFQCTFWIHLESDFAEFAKRLLGPKGKTFKNIGNITRGTRLRLRGCGSSENAPQDEELHLRVIASHRENFLLAKKKVWELLNTVIANYEAENNKRVTVDCVEGEYVPRSNPSPPSGGLVSSKKRNISIVPESFVINTAPSSEESLSIDTQKEEA